MASSGIPIDPSDGRSELPKRAEDSKLLPRILTSEGGASASLQGRVRAGLEAENPLSEEEAIASLQGRVTPSLDAENLFSTDLPFAEAVNDDAHLGLFTVFLQDFMAVEMQDVRVSAEMSLSHLHGCLEELKRYGNVPPALLREMRDCFLISCWIEQGKSTIDRTEAIPLLKAAIIKRLKEQGSLLIPSGVYDAESGHSIPLYLHYNPSTQHVSGYILNRGAATDTHHPHAVLLEKGKILVNTQLDLKSCPLQALVETPFFELLLELQFSPTRAIMVYEFYEVLIPYWPGKVSYSTKRMHTLHRGSTCSVATFMIFILDALEKERNNFKVIHQMRLIEGLMEVMREDLNYPRIIDTIRKLFRFLKKHDREIHPDLFRRAHTLFSKALDHYLLRQEADEKEHRQSALTYDVYPMDAVTPFEFNRLTEKKREAHPILQGILDVK